MGIIYDKNVEEKELYSAYGMTVYGKENRYYSVFSPEIKSAYITLRFTNGEENLADVYLENRCVFKTTFNDTVDDFLYWIKEEKPKSYQIEDAVFKYLCNNDSLFRTRIENMKRKERKKKEAEERIEKYKAEMQKKKEFIEEKCKENKWMLYIHDYYPYSDVYIFNPLSEAAREFISYAMESESTVKLNYYIQFCEEHPENKDLEVVHYGNIEGVFNALKGEEANDSKF